MTAPDATKHVVLGPSLLQTETAEPILTLVQEIVASSRETGARVWYTAGLLDDLRSGGLVGSKAIANELERLLPGGLVTPLSVPGYQRIDHPVDDSTTAAQAIAELTGATVHHLGRARETHRERYGGRELSQGEVRYSWNGLPDISEALGLARDELNSRAAKRYATVEPLADRARNFAAGGGFDEEFQKARVPTTGPRHPQLAAGLPVDVILDLEQVPNELGSMLIAAAAARGQELRIHLTPRTWGEPDTEFADLASIAYHRVSDDLATAAGQALELRGDSPALRTVVTDRRLSPTELGRCNEVGFAVRDDLDGCVAWLLNQEPTAARATVDRAALLAGPVDEPTFLRRLREIAPATSAVVENPRLRAWEDDSLAGEVAAPPEPQPLAVVVPYRIILTRSDRGPDDATPPDGVSPLRALVDAFENRRLISLEWPEENEPPSRAAGAWEGPEERKAADRAVTRAASGPREKGQILTRVLALATRPYYPWLPNSKFDHTVTPVEFLDEFFYHEPERTRHAVRQGFATYRSMVSGANVEVAADFVNGIVGSPSDFLEFRVSEFSALKVRKAWLDAFDSLRAETYAACLGKQPDEFGAIELDGAEQRALFGKRRNRFGGFKVTRGRPALSRADIGKKDGVSLPFPDGAAPRPPEGEPWDGKRLRIEWRSPAEAPAPSPAPNPVTTIPPTRNAFQIARERHAPGHPGASGRRRRTPRGGPA